MKMGDEERLQNESQPIPDLAIRQSVTMPTSFWPARTLAIGAFRAYVRVSRRCPGSTLSLQFRAVLHRWQDQFVRYTLRY
jgi:hypothetical protein